MQSKVTTRGRTVIPAKIRRDHHIGLRTRLEWIDDGRSIRVVPVPRDPIETATGISRGLGARVRAERDRERSERPEGTSPSATSK
jgi:bifunctional DNA-binding transcriptional regulator/antitoxin component of YhaV-PrlF toxin-antitoxin module